jgi:hypothetical protein
MTYGEWLNGWALRLNTTVEHIEDITRWVLPRGEGPPMLGPVPPDMLRREYRIGLEFVRQAEAEEHFSKVGRMASR